MKSKENTIELVTRRGLLARDPLERGLHSDGFNSLICIGSSHGGRHCAIKEIQVLHSYQLSIRRLGRAKFLGSFGFNVHWY